MWIVEVLISLNKTGSYLDGPCSSPDSMLESGNERCVMYVYTGRSLPHTWYLQYSERQLIGILNAHTLLQLESKVQRLAHRTHWNPERQSSLTGRCLLVVAMKVLYYWPNVSWSILTGIWGWERPHQLRGSFIKLNGNFEKSQELKGRSEKFKNPLPYPTPLTHQHFRETVPLSKSVLRCRRWVPDTGTVVTFN
jgi:hypothetical protein